jgi:hypothetical protein
VILGKGMNCEGKIEDEHEGDLAVNISTACCQIIRDGSSVMPVDSEEA